LKALTIGKMEREGGKGKERKGRGRKGGWKIRRAGEDL